MWRAAGSLGGRVLGVLGWREEAWEVTEASLGVALGGVRLEARDPGSAAQNAELGDGLQTLGEAWRAEEQRGRLSQGVGGGPGGGGKQACRGWVGAGLGGAGHSRANCKSCWAPVRFWGVPFFACGFRFFLGLETQMDSLNSLQLSFPSDGTNPAEHFRRSPDASCPLPGEAVPPLGSPSRMTPTPPGLMPTELLPAPLQALPWVRASPPRQPAEAAASGGREGSPPLGPTSHLLFQPVWSPPGTVGVHIPMTQVDKGAPEREADPGSPCKSRCFLDRHHGRREDPHSQGPLVLSTPRGGAGAGRGREAGP